MVVPQGALRPAHRIWGPHRFGEPRPMMASNSRQAVRLSAIVPLWNKEQYIGQCLRSLVEAADRHGTVEIIVVDNGSTDDSLAALAPWSGKLKRLSIPRQSISAARNAGAAVAEGEVLCFVDADCVVPQDYFDRIEDALEEHGAAATGFEVRLPVNGSWIERTWGALHDRSDDGARHYLNAANFAVRRDAFERVGGFDARLLTGEDTDICLRLRQAGGLIWAERATQVVHMDNPRTVRAFFAKERWRGRGGFTRLILTQRGRAPMMVLAFAATMVAAVVSLFLPVALLARAVLATLLVLSLPLATVAYRLRQGRRKVSLAQATALYLLYYGARLTALLELMRPRRAPDIRQRAPESTSPSR